MGCLWREGKKRAGTGRPKNGGQVGWEVRNHFWRVCGHAFQGTLRSRWSWDVRVAELLALKGEVAVALSLGKKLEPLANIQKKLGVRWTLVVMTVMTKSSCWGTC